MLAPVVSHAGEVFKLAPEPAKMVFLVMRGAQLTKKPNLRTAINSNAVSFIFAIFYLFPRYRYILMLVDFKGLNRLWITNF